MTKLSTKARATGFVPRSTLSAFVAVAELHMVVGDEQGGSDRARGVAGQAAGRREVDRPLVHERRLQHGDVLLFAEAREDPGRLGEPRQQRRQVVPVFRARAAGAGLGPPPARARSDRARAATSQRRDACVVTGSRPRQRAASPARWSSEHARDVHVLAAVGVVARRDAPHRRVQRPAAAGAEPSSPRRSSAWHSARSSMTATVSVSSSTRWQSRAAIEPMLTLSWLCDSVLRLKTLAGMVSFSASAVSAEALICMALNPWCAARAPTGADQIGGQAVVGHRVAQHGHLPIEQVGDVGDGRLQAVHREGDVAAVEVAAVQDLVALGVDDGVVVDAVELGLEQRLEARPARRAARR